MVDQTTQARPGEAGEPNDNNECPEGGWHSWRYSAGDLIEVGRDYPYRICRKCGQLWVAGKLVKRGQ